jgi:phosphatidylinositol kinase/protein kinase (PI-3  family)
LNSLKKRYHRAIDGRRSTVDLIDSAEISEHIYNSNAIENSTLSLEETENNIVNLTIFLVVVHGFFNKSINCGTKQIAEYFSSFYCLMVGNK